MMNSPQFLAVLLAVSVLQSNGSVNDVTQDSSVKQTETGSGNITDIDNYKATQSLDDSLHSESKFEPLFKSAENFHLMSEGNEFNNDIFNCSKTQCYCSKLVHGSIFANC